MKIDLKSIRRRFAPMRWEYTLQQLSMGDQDHMLAAMRLLGNQGWELVQMEKVPSDNVHIGIFKRPLKD